MDLDPTTGEWRWASYAEWRERSWVPRVLAKAEDIQSRDDNDLVLEQSCSTFKGATHVAGQLAERRGRPSSGAGGG
jgi:hypothetical protein